MICFWLRLELANELTLLVTVAEAPRGRRYDSATRSRSLGLQQCYGLLAHVLAMAQGRRRTIRPRLVFYAIATPASGDPHDRFELRYAARR